MLRRCVLLIFVVMTATSCRDKNTNLNNFEDMNKNEKCTINGSIGERVCSYSFVKIINGSVPKGFILIDGFFHREKGHSYLYMNRESSISSNYTQALEIVKIEDLVYKDRPDLFQNKIVRIVGYYEPFPTKPTGSPYQTSGSISVSSIRYFEGNVNNTD